MKISVFEAETWERETFQHRADRHDIRFEAEPLDRHLAPEHADACACACATISSSGAPAARAVSATSNYGWARTGLAGREGAATWRGHGVLAHNHGQDLRHGGIANRTSRIGDHTSTSCSASANYFFRSK